MQHWITTRGGIDKLLIVLVRGNILWDGATSDFDWERTDAVPRILSKASANEPLYVDLREVLQRTSNPTLVDPVFYDVIAPLAAPLHCKSKDALTGEDLRQSRQFKRARVVVVAALAVLIAAVLTAGAQSIRESREAHRQSKIAERWATLRVFATRLILTDQVEGTKNFATVLKEPRNRGVTIGIRPWSQYAGNLNELLSAFDRRDRDQFVKIFGGGDGKLAQDLIAYVAKPQGGLGERNPRFNLSDEAWLEKFRAAAKVPTFLTVQNELAFAAFQAEWKRLRTEAPEIRTERGVAFALDIVHHSGRGSLVRIVKAARKPGMSERELLHAMERESKRAIRMRPIEHLVEARRRLFLTTPLLEDKPVSGRLAESPPWYRDVVDWVLEMLRLRAPVAD